MGPMPLTTYEEVRPFAPLIKDRVVKRIMPPYHVDPTIGIQAYKNDIRLSKEEINTIVQWVDAGTPEGDPADLPPPGEWPAWGEWWLEGELGPPDLVLTTDPIKVRAMGPDMWPSQTLEWEGFGDVAVYQSGRGQEHSEGAVVPPPPRCKSRAAGDWAVAALVVHGSREEVG